MNPLNPYDEHLRDSAPDASRFDGFDRGDLGRQELVVIDDLADDEPRPAAVDVETTRASALRRGKSIAVALLAGLGALGSRLKAAVAPQMPTARFIPHSASSHRRAKRALVKAVGRRQERRVRCRGYAMKRAALAG